MSIKRKLKPVKDKSEVVYRADEQKILYPKEEMLRLAVKHKTWLYGETKDTLNGVDYTMFDFTISGLSGFTADKIKVCQNDFEILKLFYGCLYPFIDNLVTQYEFNRDNCAGLTAEYKPTLRSLSNEITNKKIALEFIQQLGKLKEYEIFKKKFSKEVPDRKPILNKVP